MLKQHAHNNEFEHQFLRRISEATSGLPGENFLTGLQRNLIKCFNDGRNYK